MQVLTEIGGRIRLDRKDLRILYSLCQNIRVPLSQIAKEAMLSRTSVENRIKNMRMVGLIVGSKTIINIQALGYHTYHVFIRPLSKMREKLFLEKVLKDGNVNAVISYSGGHGFEISIMAKSPSEFLNLKESVFGGFNVEYKCSLIILKTIHSVILPKYFFADIGKKETKIAKTMDTSYQLDKKDIEIIKLLNDNAEIPIIEMAKMLGINKHSMAYRLKRLINNRIILQFRPAINFSILGMSVHTLLVNTKSGSPDEVKKFEDYFKNCEETLWMAKTFGEWQYLIYLVTKENEEIHRFIQNLRTNFEGLLGDFELLFAYKEYKYNFMSSNINVQEGIKERKS
ncbi:Lrp/AsnC family transcriptional regulator [archaeon]|nr:Lrp/AsnC family transcriptional regulator [archaeon]